CARDRTHYYGSSYGEYFDVW
nr:immunoglobulin heavy chain junction region [Mus musculus]MBK4189780.1 immunoglobulin heavy chain junction region [Mus musculus]MBK4189783.1 immunoglobulin heavy chain junction region [Mus musculus]MBK4189785.1 immunoglobulin heavy chain junction region [Mus musculus]MBK4189786.1 immunoglobulin heavy chain junction region [Mus musculus]